MSPDFDRYHFTALLRIATEQAFCDLVQQIGNERLYTFGLYTNGEATYVSPTANTEEALARKAYAQATRDGQPFELLQQSLRWSPCDLGWASQLNNPECCRQLQHEFDQGYAAFRQLTEMRRPES
jgi:hypothetical protein